MNKIKIKIIQVFLLFKYIIARIITHTCKCGCVMLICERGTDARDNAFVFFEYIQNNHPEIESYFIITKDSPDRKKLDKYGNNVVTYRSFRNVLIYCRATHLISTHIHGYHPDVNLFNRLESLFDINRNKKCISLKHGITKDYLPGLQYSETKLDLLICGAKPEFDYMERTYGYPHNNLQYTGFCRFDKLLDFNCKKQILVMPTWRRWLCEENFIDSEYFYVYKTLLSDSHLNSILVENGIKIIFYPHHELQPLIRCFRELSLSDNIVIADKYHYDVQQLLKDSLLLITDYSSVFFDFAYMRKPVVFYQFDKEKYREGHYSEGYFNYDYSFGPVVTNQKDLIEFIKIALQKNFVLAEKYSSIVDEYFPLRDNNNCKRVYNAIINLPN